MSDGRKRLSGAEYKKRAKLKVQKEQSVVKQTRKLDSYGYKKEVTKPINEETESEINTLSQVVRDVTEKNKNESVLDLDCVASSSKTDDFDKSVQLPTNTSSGLICSKIVSTNIGVSLNKHETLTVQTNNSDEPKPSTLDKDPAFWVLNDACRNEIATSGYDQNLSADFSKSKRQYSDQQRFLSKALFQRKMANGEVCHRTWMIYSESKGSVFCGPCLAFNMSHRSQFDEKDGFNDWKNGESRSSHHEASPIHKSSIIGLKELGKLKNRIDSKIVSQLDKEVNYWRQILTRVVAAVKALTSRGLALRGDNEVFGSVRNGNYLMALELIAEFDPVLATHIEAHGNCGSGKTNYLSSTICDEVIELMANEVRTAICEELKKSKYFSLVVDSTPDISHVDQLTLAVRYVLSNGAPCERFLTFIPNSGHKAEQMFVEIIAELKKLNINVTDCRGQSYDNASNMSGLYNGLQAKIQELAPLALFIPCAAHSLNLVGTSAAEACEEACHFFMLLQELYVFFSCSTKRWESLMKEFNSPTTAKTLKKVCPTRWSARNDACQSLRESFEEVLNALIFIEQDKTEKAKTKCEAKGIRQRLERFETLFMVCFWSNLLHRINKTSKTLQSETADVLLVRDLYGSLEEFCKGERNNFNHYELLAMTLSKKSEPSYEKDTKRIPKRKVWHDEEREEVTERNGRDEFRVNTYLLIIDRFISEFKRRKSAYDEYQERFYFLQELTKGNLSSEVVRQKAANLKGIYTEDLEDDFIEECVHFQAHCIAGLTNDHHSLQGLSKFLRYHSLEDVYPNINIALRICLSIPATNCVGERSFSCLRRIKNYLRSNMAETKLNSLAILCIESSVVQELSYNKIIDEFAILKSRRKIM